MLRQPYTVNGLEEYVSIILHFFSGDLKNNWFSMPASDFYSSIRVTG